MHTSTTPFCAYIYENKIRCICKHVKSIIENSGLVKYAF